MNMVTETRFTVRYAETDQMGIAHHSNYPIWFEAGKTDFLRKAKIPITDMELYGILLPLSYIECHFKNPTRYEDEIVVKTKIKKMSGVRVEFEYEVQNNGQLLAKGATTHAFTDKKLKIFNIEKAFPEMYTALQAAI